MTNGTGEAGKASRPRADSLEFAEHTENGPRMLAKEARKRLLGLRGVIAWTCSNFELFAPITRPH